MRNWVDEVDDEAEPDHVLEVEFLQILKQPMFLVIMFILPCKLRQILHLELVLLLIMLDLWIGMIQS